MRINKYQDACTCKQGFWEEDFSVDILRALSSKHQIKKIGEGYVIAAIDNPV